ncbi:MAG TPA: PEP-CTERM sorting domain-containing protein [Desulfobulbaceae bacterium]|nr:PEP-CTERM sorting domain-containing protein [Desulfobulbaceae bacterium]
MQLPEETAWFNPDNSDNDFQQIIEINSYSVKLAQEQGSLRAVYNDWPVSETNQSSRVEFHPVPEPASLLMIGLGIFGLAMLSRLQQNRI